LNKLHDWGFIKDNTIPAGRIVRGHFSNTSPISSLFGYDREGGPVDRYYIERFLQTESGHIHGRILEIGDNDYTLRFGKEKVTQTDILHVDPSNKAATFIGDLAHAPQIPDGIFDCIILTQTLHLIYNFEDAIRTCHRILKPGGTLLFTSPGITNIDQGEWKNTWYWSFTEASVKRMMQNSFPKENITVSTYGNVSVAAAFLYGMGLNEISEKELHHNDPHYPVIITAKMIKPQ